MNLRPSATPAPRSTVRQTRAFRAASAKLAGAMLLLSGLATSAFAQATWVGGTSQDWNTGANWSVNPPTGVITINTAGTTYPIFTGAQAFTVGDTIVGSGSGNTGRFDINSGTFSTGGGRLRIGDVSGTGTVNIAAGATVTTAEASLGQGTAGAGNATLNVSGTLSATGQVRVSNGSNNVIGSVGVLNVLNGGTVNSEGDLIVAFAGSGAASGTVNIETGGTVNVASTLERWLIINQWDPLHGHLNVNGGTLNINANTDIRFSTGNNNTVGSSSLTLNAGAINGGASSVLDLNQNNQNTTGANQVNNTVNLNGGVLTISQIISRYNAGTRTLNFNGGTVRATATIVDFIPATAASVANVKAGGAIFDTNGFDVTVAETLAADATSTGGGLTKLGTGTLTLTAANTYTGDTAVNAGVLTLADNASLKIVVGATGVSTKITGSGTLNLNGDLVLDLTAAGTTVGDSWQLVDANLTTTYGATFTFGDFALTAGKWLKQIAGVYYQFDPATGALSVINNPTVPAPTVTARPSRASYATGSDIQFGVNATGVGTLTYQWYFQATGSSTPVLIDGATSATYVVSNAAAGSEGVYSVVVTDSAASQTTTTTFPTFTLQAGTAFTAAYYRFEEGTALATISSVTDSGPGNNTLTALGTPNYADDSLPYSIVPRTGATNTLGANFPATGNHGLVAPATGTLASAALEDFTIEAFVRLDSLAGWQTIVGRDDDANPGQGVGGQALFYLSKAGGAVGTGLNNAFRIELITKDNVNIQVNSQTVPTVGTWYHVAAVGDATKGTLTLYVNGAAVGSTTGYTGLLVPTSGSDTPWTLGRGDFGAADVDFLRGDLDEVRFSTTALPPSQFLLSTDAGNVVPPVITQAPEARTLAVGATTTLSVVATGENLTYQWYKNDTIIPGQTASTYTLSNVTAASEGTYKVKVINPIGATLGTEISSSVSAFVRVLTLPSAGRRTIGLNFVGAGSGNWSSVIGTFAAGDTVGFYPSTNWNNSAAATGVFTQTTPLALLESTGANPAGTSATWASGNTWSARIETGTPDVKSPHGKLIHGYIESRSAAGSTVSLTNIPYATYDVFVYVSGGNGGDRTGSVSINREGSATYYYYTRQNDTTQPTATFTAEAPYAPLPMIAEATTDAAARTSPTATFVRYTGLTGADLTITGKDSVLNQNAGGIAAIQIVDTTPVGTAYPPIITTAPASKLVKGGATVSLSVAATAANSGGTLAYAWTKAGSPTVLGTAATLDLGTVASAASGDYTVTITETSSLGTSTATRTASVVVVDADRSLLINGDLNAGAGLTQTGAGILQADNTQTAGNLGQGAIVWNGLPGAAGSATLPLAKDSAGLTLPGLTFSYSGAAGAEDNTALGDIATSAALQLSRDYLYTDDQVVPITATIGGLQAFAGHRVTLLVYAYGKNSKALLEAADNDTATIALNTANNHLALASAATTTWETGTSDAPGRRLEYNNLDYTGGQSAAYVSFTGVVAANGTVSWTVGADTDAGRIPLVGFQLLLTSENLAPAAPTNLQAAVVSNQVNLSWNSSAGASTYTVARGTVSGGPYADISVGVTTGTTYTDSGVSAGNTYYYVVSAVASNPALASAYSNQASATLVATTTALENWRQTHFGTTANTGDAADSADPDNDGLANLLEYALGTGPNATNASPLVLARSGNVLTLSYPHVGDPTITYHVDATNDLAATWTLDTTGKTFTTPGTAVHTDTADLSAQTRRFLRLRVTTP